MRKATISALLLVIGLGSCGKENKPPNGRLLVLTSDAFKAGGAIPARFTCDGAGEAPPLRWSDPPPTTKSLALVVDDPDAPGGTFRHWGVFDIPAGSRSIASGIVTGVQARNDFGTQGYGPPCPPKGAGLHHYHFKLFALPSSTLSLARGAPIRDIESAASRSAIAGGELIGTYERK